MIKNLDYLNFTSAHSISRTLVNLSCHLHYLTSHIILLTDMEVGSGSHVLVPVREVGEVLEVTAEGCYHKGMY